MPTIANNFDYAALESEARIIVRQKTDEIRDRVKRAAQDIVAIGERLVVVRNLLPEQKFSEWLRGEFDWNRTTAYRMMSVANAFGCSNLEQLNIAPSALYLLASPSTPADIREEIIAEAASGKTVTHAEVKERVSASRPSILGDDFDAVTPLEQTERLDAIDPLLVKYHETHEEMDAEPDAEPEIIVTGKMPPLYDAEPSAREYGTEAETSLESLVAAGRKFGCIYADPPWQYGNQGTRAATDNHYPTMSLADISALPVASLAADNAHLHLWTTNGFLFDAKAIMEAWGFTYKSCFVWVKTQMGIGNYWRVSHEFMLLGTRGSCPFLNRSQMSWKELSRTKHSQKPAEIRGAIELVSPGPRLELFGRAMHEGWTVWGNQIAKSMFSAEVPA